MAMWAMLRESPGGGIVESWFWPDDAALVRSGLAAAGIGVAAVPEVFCEVPVSIARERDRLRRKAGRRHPVHGAQHPSDEWWDRIAESARPLGLGAGDHRGHLATRARGSRRRPRPAHPCRGRLRTVTGSATSLIHDPRHNQHLFDR